MIKKKIIVCMTALTITAGVFAANPLLQPYKTPYQTVPFDQLKTEHFMAAFDEAMLQNKAEIDAIVNNLKPATFENTIVALDRSGRLLAGFFTFLQSAGFRNQRRAASSSSGTFAQNERTQQFHFAE